MVIYKKIPIYCRFDLTTESENIILILVLFGGIGIPRIALRYLEINIKTINYVEIMKNHKYI
ncbi:hypothetical protein B0P06_004818 [Clostridium saccharoperbutylacetonicum]|nr:hypothetical protein [Clostridium saccharoperbutylacetonicum]NSB45047.1 hypothetical protein [Clostridium saccharoperbutylacetonicum]